MRFSLTYYISIQRNANVRFEMCGATSSLVSGIEEEREEKKKSQSPHDKKFFSFHSLFSFVCLCVMIKNNNNIARKQKLKRKTLVQSLPLFTLCSFCLVSLDDKSCCLYVVLCVVCKHKLNTSNKVLKRMNGFC